MALTKQEKKKMITERQKKVNLIFKDIDYWRLIDKAIIMDPKDIIEQITDSGLKGRGGAGFPTGIKWKLAAEQKNDIKYIICNADEGEPGTFKDREILEKQAEKVFAGMVLCALAIGSKEGFIYLRGEYSYLLPELNRKLNAFSRGLKSRKIDFIISIRLGSGAYVCGEETALIDSMEGLRG